VVVARAAAATMGVAAVVVRAGVAATTMGVAAAATDQPAN
jgi:hypothetical protein